MIERFGADPRALSVQTQRRFKVRMLAPGGDVTVRVSASSLESVIDQVKHRRIATPPGMTSFSVEDDDAEEV